MVKTDRLIQFRIILCVDQCVCTVNLRDMPNERLIDPLEKRMISFIPAGSSPDLIIDYMYKNIDDMSSSLAETAAYAIERSLARE